VLDALHLACALRHEAELVTADTVISRAGKHFGLRVKRLKA
jgi:predicted nucleic acid-binding protein